MKKAPRLIPREDDDVSDTVREILQAENIDIKLGVNEVGFAKQPDQVVVNCKDEQGEFQVSGSHILFAIGRKPNTDKLGLDAAGVEVDERGFIKVDDQLKTNIEGIWGLG